MKQLFIFLDKQNPFLSLHNHIILRINIIKQKTASLLKMMQPFHINYFILPLFSRRKFQGALLILFLLPFLKLSLQTG